MITFKGYRIEKALILIRVRWYLAYPLSYRNLEEMMCERGVQVDHMSIYRWVQKFTAKLEVTFRQSKMLIIVHPLNCKISLQDKTGQFKWLNSR